MRLKGCSEVTRREKRDLLAQEAQKISVLVGSSQLFGKIAAGFFIRTESLESLELVVDSLYRKHILSLPFGGLPLFFACRGFTLNPFRPGGTKEEGHLFGLLLGGFFGSWAVKNLEGPDRACQEGEMF